MIAPIPFDNEAYMENIELSDSNPKEALINNAKWLAFYGSQLGKWEKAESLLEDQLETAKAIIILRLKKEEDKCPKHIMDAHITLDPEVKEIKAELRVATENVSQYKNAHKAFTNRGMNASALNSNLREEQKQTHSSAYPPMSSDEKELRKSLLRRVSQNKEF